MAKADSAIFKEYDYVLPGELIAKEQAVPRDSARLFAYDAKKDEITFDVFKNVGAHLPPKSLFVLNETKVLPARARLTKKSGGVVEILFLVNERAPGGPIIRGLPDREVVIGETLSFKSGETITALSHNAQYFSFRLGFPPEQLNDLLGKYGTMPIPKYLGEFSLKETELRERYQTVFAREGASAAAPTASLHFTNELLNELSQGGFEFAKVRLDVGLGTFAPVSKEQIEKGELHKERYVVSARASNAMKGAKEKKISVIAVGTTAMRTIESAADSIAEGKSRSGETKIFIRPPHEFKIVDALITNFHLPRTSLMALVDAFLEYKGANRRIVELYKIAIENRFRFYSFGDAMLVT